MSNLFMGSSAPGVKASSSGPMLPKGGHAAAAAQALSLEELDRPAHCPEGVDADSWRHLCKLRRRKIKNEEEIAVLVAQLSETEDVKLYFLHYGLSLDAFQGFFKR